MTGKKKTTEEVVFKEPITEQVTEQPEITDKAIDAVDEIAQEEKKTDQYFDRIKHITMTADIITIGYTFWEAREILTKEQIAELNEILINRRILRIVKKGLRAFEIEGKQVIAINEKNAIRKATGVSHKKKKVPYNNDYSFRPKKHHKHYDIPKQTMVIG